MGTQGSASLIRAAEVMARLKNGTNQVVVVGLPPRPGETPMARTGPAPSRMSRDDLLAALVEQFKTNLRLESCGVACDQNGHIVSGSVMVVAVVPTEEDTDLGLL